MDAMVQSLGSGIVRSASRKGYRTDIDGLRAIAVLAVVLFHADIEPFSGGFVGVDIFFVISGYLITRLITDQIDRGTFSLATFYERRLRRLYPALFATLVASTVAGALILLPRDFALLARNTVGAAMFVSNIFFWMETGYFNGDAHVRALLHTWSLAVEEQYYIFYPLLLMLVARFCPRHRLVIIAGLALLSFVACLWVMKPDPSAAFYLMPFRAWELLLGGLLTFDIFPPVRNRHLQTAESLGGFILIGIAVFCFDELTPFPGAAALIPCIGAALLIHAGRRSLSGNILSHRIPRFLGHISYSVYLWHWPLLVFLNYYVIAPLSRLESLGVVMVSIALGALSWHYIELPFRRKPADPRTSRNAVFAIAAASTVLICVASTLIYVKRGLPDRFPEDAVHLASYAGSMNPESDQCADVNLQLAPGSTCTIGPPDRADTFLWGDSHAGALFGALDQISKEGRGIVYGATPRCPPLLEMGTSSQCLEGNRRKLAYVLSRPDIHTVILAARWSLYLKGRDVAGDAETNNGAPQLMGADGQKYALFSKSAARHFEAGLSGLVSQLLASGKQVILVYPIPETGYDVPSTLALLASRGDNPANFTTSHFLYLRRERRALRILDRLGQNEALSRIYPDRVLCHAGQCQTYANGAALYFDSHHLSIPGARELLPALRTALLQPSARRPSSS